jgi:sulfatase maturation enzyme AslB (radical SAM superfamily)
MPVGVQWSQSKSVPRRFAVFKRWIAFLAVTALFAMVGTPVAAQKAATPKSQDNVAKGESEVRHLLPLMDQDKQGKVSKEEFMRFMAAEFDRLDKKNEGKLDVKDLTQPPVQPVKSFHK